MIFFFFFTLERVVVLVLVLAQWPKAHFGLFFSIFFFQRAKTPSGQKVTLKPSFRLVSPVSSGAHNIIRPMSG